MSKPKYSMKLGLILFIIITFLTTIIILGKTFNLKTLNALKAIKTIHIVIIAFLIFMNWLLETFKLQVLTTIANVKIKFKPAFYAVLGNIFFSAITPFQSGGGAIQIYIMYQYGIGPGKATAISFLKASLTIFALSVATPIIIIFSPELLSIKLLNSFFIISLIISLLLILIYIYLLIRPDILKNFAILILRGIKKIRLISKNRFQYWVNIIIKEINIFNDINLSCWKYHKLKLLYGLILTLLVLISNFLIAPVILLFLYPDMKIKIMYLIYFSIITQLVIHFIIYFIPTPGGKWRSGIKFYNFFSKFSSLINFRCLYNSLEIVLKYF